MVWYTSRHFWVAVWRTYSKGPRSSLERFSGLVEGMISRLVKPSCGGGGEGDVSHLPFLLFLFGVLGGSREGRRIVRGSMYAG